MTSTRDRPLSPRQEMFCHHFPNAAREARLRGGLGPSAGPLVMAMRKDDDKMSSFEIAVHGCASGSYGLGSSRSKTWIVRRRRLDRGAPTT